MALELKMGQMLWHKRRFFGSNWRVVHCVLYNDSSFLWYEYKDWSIGEQKGGVVLKDGTELIAFGPDTSAVPNRPSLPDNYEQKQMLAIGVRGKDIVYWFLCRNEAAVQSWMDAIAISEKVCQQDIMSLARVNNHLAVQLHRMLAKEKENVFFSPFGISTCMGMLLCAAEKETAVELKSALGYDHAELKMDEIASIFQKQMSVFLKKDDSYTLSCANSMLSQKGFDVKDAYKKILEASFQALVLEADFMRETQKVLTHINGWVNEKTNGMIPKLIDSLDPSTVMILLNAVYFKGTWKHQFDKDATRLQKFYNKGSESNGKLIDMMYLEKSFPFYEDETLKVVQLPYVGDEIAMMIILPQAKDGLESVEAGLSSFFVQDLKKKLRKQKIKVTLPRFKLEYKKSLVSYFQQLGVQRAFRRGAELGIASDSPDLAVSEILHKAVLEVNEEGCEAAAVTMGRFMLCAFVIEPEFVVDHPFAFVIYDTRSDLILFMGRVEDL